MAGLLRLLIVGGIAVAGIGFILSQVLGFTISVSRLTRKLKRDILTLRSELEPFMASLIPIEREELELLSLSMENVIKKGRFGTITKGHLSTIYNENVAAFAYKTYDDSKFLMVLDTEADKYTYVGTEEGTDVYINDKEYGNIDNSGILRTFDKKIELGRLVDQSNRYSDLLVGERKLASLVNPKLKNMENARAFPVLADYTDSDEQVLLSLSTLSIVQRSID